MIFYSFIIGYTAIGYVGIDINRDTSTNLPTKIKNHAHGFGKLNITKDLVVWSTLAWSIWVMTNFITF